MGAIIQQIKSYAIKGVLIIGIPVIVLGGLIGAFASANNSYGDYADYSAYLDLGEYVFKIDEEDAMPTLTKTQLKTAIEECYSGNEQMNLLAQLDTLVSVQNETKINAAFIVAAMHNENVEEINKEKIETFAREIAESLNNNEQASAKVQDIASEKYSDDWANNVEKELDKIFASVIPSSYGAAEAAEGDGYTQIYKNGKKAYKLFEQWSGSYAGKTWAGSSMQSGACGPSSTAIILTGFGINKSPWNVVSECTSETERYGARTIESLSAYFQHYGINAPYYKCGSVDNFTNSDATAIISHLKTGNPVLMLITQPMQLLNGNRASTGVHYVTLLGINSKNIIFVGDPGCGVTDGETTMQIIREKARPREYILVNKKS